ncbi:hypothetical protein Hanom_Chr15g01357491 [Helianthus anomalus]
MDCCFINLWRPYSFGGPRPKPHLAYPWAGPDYIHIASFWKIHILVGYNLLLLVLSLFFLCVERLRETIIGDGKYRANIEYKFMIYDDEEKELKELC